MATRSDDVVTPTRATPLPLRSVKDLEQPDLAIRGDTGTTPSLAATGHVLDVLPLNIVLGRHMAGEVSLSYERKTLPGFPPF